MSKLDFLRESWADNISILINDCGFNFFLRSRTFDQCMTWVNTYEEEIECAGFKCAYGQTRLVIADKKLDSVIKIEFVNNFCDSSGNQELFLCQGETEVYAEAKRRGYGSYFAPCIKLMDYKYDSYIYYGEDESHDCLCPIYLMAYCEIDEDAVIQGSSSYYYEMNEEYFYSHPESEPDPYLVEDDEQMVSYACHTWGMDEIETEDFWEFIEEMNVMDLHSGNWGYLNGHLVLCDYAGFGQKVGPNAWS